VIMIVISAPILNTVNESTVDCNSDL